MRHLLSLTLIIGLVSPLVAADSVKAAKPDQAALEQAFAEKLTGASLVGSFSTDGKDGKAGDKYQIASVKKLQGDTWLITYKAKIGEQMVDLPIAIKVLWAGDTPVMTLDDFTIPGIGTFSARVLFHGDRYVGTWQHGDVGGAMWGRVEKKAEAKPEAEKK